jgi:hypothetical protein
MADIVFLRRWGPDRQLKALFHPIRQALDLAGRDLLVTVANGRYPQAARRKPPVSFRLIRDIDGPAAECLGWVESRQATSSPSRVDLPVRSRLPNRADIHQRRSAPVLRRHERRWGLRLVPPHLPGAAPRGPRSNAEAPEEVGPQNKSAGDVR